MPQNADVIVIGAGLAGLVAVAELVEAGQHVIVLEQEPEASLGGQAHWSLAGCSSWTPRSSGASA